MALDITHPDILTPSNKLNDILYGHSHLISGKLPYSDLDIGSGIPTCDIDISTPFPESAVDISSIETPTLISTKEVTGVSEIEFPNLDGNADKYYFLTGLISFPDYTTETIVYLILNNDTTLTNYIYDAVHWGSNTVNTRTHNWNTQCMGFVRNYGYAYSRCLFRLLLFAESGYYRIAYFNSKLLSNPSSPGFLGEWTGESNWNNTTNNITNIKIKLTQSTTISGQINLYKISSLLEVLKYI